VTERELTKAIVAFARERGWLVAHFETARAMREGGGYYTPQRGDKGFPDLVMVRASRLVFAELKTARGHVDFAQATWLNRLDGVGGIVGGVECYIWRPADWPDDVARVLS